MLVSVIIPTYNRADTIERAVNSVLAQTWRQLEVIVVDDGSTDQTVAILKKYGDKIRVIRRQNGGPAVARNTGIKAATGEIISFLDSDDAWLPSKTERQVNLLQRTESSGVVCCVCNARMLYASRVVTTFQVSCLHPELAEGVWSNPADIIVDRFLLFNQVASIRREALSQAGFFREDLPFGLNDDYDLSLRLALVGPWAFIADTLVEWHEHSGNISRSHSKLAICAQTIEILQNINNVPYFRGKMPQALLRRRLRLLSFDLCALRMGADESAAIRALGRSFNLFLRGYRALNSRLPFRLKMRISKI